MLKKKIKRIAISAGVLVVVFFIAGLAYVYMSDLSTEAGPQIGTLATSDYNPIKPPPKPGPHAAVGVAEEAFDTPAAPGADTSIIISTTPGATCSISVAYNSHSSKSTDPALAPKVADGYGNVTWSWVIPYGTALGSYPVAVTCRLDSHWAVFDDKLVIKQ